MKSNANKQKRKSPVAAGCSALGIFLLIVIIAVCIPLTVPKVFGYQIYTVVSGSMEPEIPVGSLVFIEGFAPEDVEEGDVIAFYGARDELSIITHRVVENRILMGELITKGDANETNDMNPVPYDNFIGKARLSIPIAGYIAGFLAELPGKITAAVLIAVSLLLQAAASAIDKKNASLHESSVD